MPTSTFHHLAPEKQERITAAAAGLFAGLGFHRTDVAQIAARAGVAKGSIYNYFASKEDLYLHVCRHGLEKSRQAVYGGLSPEWDVFTQIDHIFRQGAGFVLANPEYLRLYLNIASAGMDRFAAELTVEVEKHTADYLKGQLKKAVASGAVRADLDVNWAAFLINSLYIVFQASLVTPHFRLRLAEYLELAGGTTEGVPEAAVEDLINQITRLIDRMLRPLPEPAG